VASELCSRKLELVITLFSDAWKQDDTSAQSADYGSNALTMEILEGLTTFSRDWSVGNGGYSNERLVFLKREKRVKCGMQMYVRRAFH